MARSERFVVGLDIGSSKIACVIGEVGESGAVHLVGLGEAPSRGLRKGVVVNLPATVDAIKASVEEAELMAGVEVESATVGIAGSHIRSFNSRGVVATSGKENTVTREDLRRVMDAARAVSIPADREILHVLPQEFVVDEESGIDMPVGMRGSRLEANVHIVTAATASVQNLVTCVNRAGVEVRDTVLEQLAVSEAIVSADEKDLGVAVIDVGGGSSEMAIFEKGSVWHTSVLAVGGEHFTNDLAVGLRSPIPDAERLKRKHGYALSGLVTENEPIEVPTVGGRKPRLLSSELMAEILQPRAEEVFALFREEIVRSGFEKLLNAGVVLTGGGSLLPGMVEVAEQTLDLPVRRGTASGASEIVDDSVGPHHSTAIGLALYGARHCGPRRRLPVPMPSGRWFRIPGRVRAWFTENVFGS